MTAKKKTSLLVLAVSAFLTGVLFTTAGANLFGHGDRVATDTAARETTPITNAQPKSSAPRGVPDFITVFEDIAEATNPGVVQIRSERVQRRTTTNPFQGTPFQDFFGRDGIPDEFRSEGLGSGVIISDDGYIITNNHVVSSSEDLEVKLFDGRYFDAEIVGRDVDSDLAVIKIGASDLPRIPYGRIADVRVGQWVMAFGSPLSQDLSNSVTAGIVSAIGRTGDNLRNLNISSFIQTDAAINPGNSGGALVNLNGELVGINSAILSRSGGSQGVGFAIPVDVVESVVSQLIAGGEVQRGFLGIMYGPVSPALAKALDVSRGAAQITDVTDGGAAQKSGLKIGDIITAVNEEPLQDDSQLLTQIANRQPGDRVRLSVIREQEELVLDVKLDARPLDLARRDTDAGDVETDEELSSLGLTLRSVSPQTLRAIGIDPNSEDAASSGVAIIDIDTGSDAYREAELRGSDIIVEIDGRPVANRESFERTYKDMKSGSTFIVRVIRYANGQPTSFITALEKP